MYTKAQIIDQVYLAVTGGKPSPDVRVYRADIVKYVEAAVIEAIRDEERERHIRMMRESRAGLRISSDNKIDPGFTKTLTRTIQEDANGRKYIEVDGILNLPDDKGLYSVRPKKGLGGWVRTSSPGSLIGTHMTTTFFWREPPYIFFENIAVNCDVLVQAAIGFTNLSDDDEIPIPSGYERFVVESATKFFFVQRDGKPDYIIDQKDDKEK